MSSYTELFHQAVERTKRFGLAVPEVIEQPGKKFLTPKAHKEFPHVIGGAFGELSPKDVVAQCLSLHYKAMKPLSTYFKTQVFYTLGWVETGVGRSLYKFDEEFIEKELRIGNRPPSAISMHAWITLPTMEIIDMTLATSYAVIKNIKDGMGGVITMDADQKDGFKYIPMLVGDDFLRKTGLLLEI